MTISPAARAAADGRQPGGGRRSGWSPVRRWTVLISAVVVASLVAVGLTAAPSQAQATVCTGELTGITVSGDLEVPPGAACVLTNVGVPGAATVGAGADLFVIGSNLSGPLTVGSSGFAQVIESTLSTRASLVDAFGMMIEDSTLSSGVDINGGLFFSTGTNVSSTIVSSDGWTFIESGQVSGDITTGNDQATDLMDVSMSGFLRVDSASTGSVVCRSSISGLLQVTNSGGLIQIGGTAPVTDCGSNVVNGEIRLEGNQADQIVVSNNLLFGNLNCLDNTPAPTGSGNMVNGDATGQCAGFGGSSALQQLPLAGPDAQPDRRQAILEVLAGRADLG